MHWAAAFALTVVCYALTGFAALSLAIPPGYASPLYPAAGVAIASVLVFGRRMLPAIALGALCVNLALPLQHRGFEVSMLPLPLMIALGASLQAFVGAELVKRCVKQPLSLSEPRDIFAFLVVGMVSSLVATSIANTGMWLTGTLGTAELPFSLATWWIGDLLGVLIGAPIVLTLIGRPRTAWAPRRRSVGITLTLVTVLLAFGIRQIVHWNNERTQSAFVHDATGAAQALGAQLREPLAALEALHSVFIASEDVTAAEMHLATRSWLASGGLQAVGWSERVRRDQVSALEARVRAEGHPRYAVFDRKDGAAAAQADDEVVAVHYVEPFASNAAVLGLNQLSVDRKSVV